MMLILSALIEFADLQGLLRLQTNLDSQNKGQSPVHPSS